MRTVGEVDENRLVARLTADFSPGGGGAVVVGAGDDCAVLSGAGGGGDSRGRYELFKTDALVAGVHFAESDPPELVGRKALCRAISDIAAMGGLPCAALVTIAISPELRLQTVDAWYRGLVAAAAEFDVALVGGETTSTIRGDAVLSVAMSGSVEPERCVLRSGAKVGDCIAVTGRLGGSLGSGRHLDFTPRLAAARWLVAEADRRPTAMMDLSDGLAKDLPRLAGASGTGYRIDPGALPLHAGVTREQALGDGEDYELLMTFATGKVPDEECWRLQFPELPLTVIGEITAGVETPLDGGWDHFVRAAGDRQR